MLAAFDRVLLRGQTECVPTHRMQHVEAAHPFVAGYDVRCGVTFGMSNVQPSPARVRKHVEYIKFWFPGIETLLAGIGRMKKLPLLPDGLPFWFDLVERIRFATLATHGCSRTFKNQYSSMQLIVATRNAHKTLEIQRILGPAYIVSDL